MNKPLMISAASVGLGAFLIGESGVIECMEKAPAYAMSPALWQDSREPRFGAGHEAPTTTANSATVTVVVFTAAQIAGNATHIGGTPLRMTEVG